MRNKLLGLTVGVVSLLLPGVVFAQELNSGDVAWVSTSAALVMLMTPALGFFYAGLVRKKNLVSTLVQCLVIFAIMSLMWSLWGYSMAFGPTIGGIVGDLSNFGLNGVGSA